MFFKTSQMEILELKNMTLQIKHSVNGHNRLERTRCSHRLQRQMSRNHLVWRQTGEVMGESKRSLRDSQGSEKCVKCTVTVEPRGEARGPVG